MTHRKAVALMILVTLLWSIAGVVTRQLDSARAFEITFWRSGFNALALAGVLSWLRGPRLWVDLRHAPALLWWSGLCWAVMYTAFMVALTLTTVAAVLVTMAIGPLLTALFARFFLHHRLPARTWTAITVAGLGIGWMFGHKAAEGGAALGGVLIALAVPAAGAINWTLLQHVGNRARRADKADIDMLPAVFIGAVISALLTLPLAWPLQASPRDISLLAFLGVFQLAIPCLLAVRLSRVLPAPEIALLCLLEVLFGVSWVWLGAGEAPSPATLIGGALVLGALITNEALALAAGRGRSIDLLAKELRP
jgi:drug/metabolite transporter (DMT)-like permease